MALTGLSALIFTCLEGPRTRYDKLLRLTNSNEPETVQVGKVMAGVACTLALNDGVGPKVLEAAASRCQRLSTALVTCSSVLTDNIPSVKAIIRILKWKIDFSHREERVSRPQTPPACRASGDRWILAVKRHCRGGSLTYHTAANVGYDFLAKDWHHGYWCGGGEPVRFVITTGVVASSFIAIGERHRGENLEARASLTYSERERRDCSVYWSSLFSITKV